MSAFCEPKNSEDHVPEALILFQKCIDEVAQRAIKLGSSPAEIKDLWKKHQTDFDKVLELFTEAFLLEDNALAALPTAVRNDNLAGTSIMPTTGPGPDHSTHSLQRATKKRKTSDSMIDLNGPEDAMAAASQGLHLPLRPAPGALQRNPSDQGHPQSDKNVPGPSDAVQNDERDFRLDTMRTHGRAVREVQNEEGRWHPDSIEDWKGNVTPGAPAMPSPHSPGPLIPHPTRRRRRSGTRALGPLASFAARKRSKWDHDPTRQTRRGDQGANASGDATCARLTLSASAKDFHPPTLYWSWSSSRYQVSHQICG